MRALMVLPFLCFGTQSALAQATPFDGVWSHGSAADCVLDPTSDAVPLRVLDGSVIFYESACQMTNPVAVRGMEATLYDMACSGEGETWSYRAMFMIDHADSLVFLQNGAVQTLTRCIGPVRDATLAAPPAAPPVK